MSARNPKRIKILSIIAILLIVGLQSLVFEMNRHAILFGDNMITTTGKIIYHEEFVSVTVEFIDEKSEKRIKTTKEIEKSHDPFIGLSLNQSLSITYDKNNHSIFFVDGYEDKPSSLVFYFILVVGLAAQIILFGVILDFFDKDLQRLK